MSKSIDVVGGVIRSGGKILCAQRGPHGNLPGMWEFPGGKIEPNETPQKALEREITEELHCHVRVGERITTTRYEYDFAVVHLTTFYCDLVSGEPQLTEHSAVRWLLPTELEQLAWAPADIPAIKLIQARP